MISNTSNSKIPPLPVWAILFKSSSKPELFLLILKKFNILHLKNPPLVAAGVHMAVAFPMIQNLLKAFNMKNTELYRNGTIGVYLGFAVLYILIYSLTAKAYYRIVKRA